MKAIEWQHEDQLSANNFNLRSCQLRRATVHEKKIYTKVDGTPRSHL